MITYPKEAVNALRLDPSHYFVSQHGIKVVYIRISGYTKDTMNNSGFRTGKTSVPTEFIKTGKYQGIGKDHPCFHRKLDFFLEPLIASSDLRSSSGTVYNDFSVADLNTYWQARYPNEQYYLGPGCLLKKAGTYGSIFLYQPRDTWFGYWDNNDFSGQFSVVKYVEGPVGFGAYIIDRYHGLINQVGYSCIAWYAGDYITLHPLTVYNSSNALYDTLRAAAETSMTDPLGLHDEFDINEQVFAPKLTYYSLNLVYTPEAFQENRLEKAVVRLGYKLKEMEAHSAANPPSKTRWGRLAVDAVKNVSFTDVNSIAYLRDLKTTFSEVKSTLELVADPTNPKKWAAAWLNFRYGTRLTISDTEKLIKAAKDAYEQYKSTFGVRFQFARSMASEELTDIPDDFIIMKRQYWYKVYYKPDTKLLKQVNKFLRDVGIFPTYSNTWDLIPLSFVADWIANFSEVFELLDHYEYQQLINVLGITYTYKDTADVYVLLSDLYFCSGNAKCVVYDRSISKALHHYRWTLNWGAGGGINIIDAAALLKL
jgi:hypothetical protein